MARTAAPRCSMRGCKMIASQPSGLCRKHLLAACDARFGALIRARGECELARMTYGDIVQCNGNLQCCHGFSRTYRGTRWDTRNSFAGCAAHHLFFTHHPDRWSEARDEWWGEDIHEELRALRESTDKTDLEAVYAELEGAS